MSEEVAFLAWQVTSLCVSSAHLLLVYPPQALALATLRMAVVLNLGQDGEGTAPLDSVPNSSYPLPILDGTLCTLATGLKCVDIQRHVTHLISTEQNDLTPLQRERAVQWHRRHPPPSGPPPSGSMYTPQSDTEEREEEERRRRRSTPLKRRRSPTPPDRRTRDRRRHCRTPTPLSSYARSAGRPSTTSHTTVSTGSWTSSGSSSSSTSSSAADSSPSARSSRASPPSRPRRHPSPPASRRRPRSPFPRHDRHFDPRWHYHDRRRYTPSPPPPRYPSDAAMYDRRRR